MRLAFVSTLAAAAMALLAPAGAAAAPCPAGTQPFVSMNAPAQVAVGRQGLISIGDNPAADSALPKAGRLEMLDENGQVFFAHDVSATELSDYNLGLKRGLFYVRLDPGDPYAIIRLSLTQSFFQLEPPFASGDCQLVLERQVTPAAPVHPKLLLTGLGDEAAVRIIHPRGCDLAPLLPVSLRVQQGGRKASFVLADSCDEARDGWLRHGRVTGISFSQHRASAREVRLVLSPATWRDSKKPYRLTLSYNGGVRVRRWAAVNTLRTPAKRIWEGTDRFWNYCIRENKDTLSSGGRLYCVEPGSADAWVTLYRRKPLL